VSVPGRLSRAEGRWEGTNRLWFDPALPSHDCATTAEVTFAARGRLLALRYDWSWDGKAEEGLLVLGDDPATGRCDAAWADSFHNSHRLMPLSGTLAADGDVSVTGTYTAPPGPDWGWRITLEQPSADALLVRMYNITPDGIAALAVEASYARRR
jgi:hypothetical protein